MVVLMDIYAAGEQPIPGITGQALAEAIRAAGHKNVVFHSSMQEGIEELLRAARPGRRDPHDRRGQREPRAWANWRASWLVASCLAASAEGHPGRETHRLSLCTKPR